MKWFNRFVAVGLVMLALTAYAPNAWAEDGQDAQQAATADQGVSEAAPQTPQEPAKITEPQAGGVHPSLVFKGDVADFLKLLGEVSHTNIVPSPAVRGMVTVNLFDVTLAEALDAVLGVNGFVYEEEGPFIFVYTQKEWDERQAQARKMECRIFPLSYIPAQDATQLIRPLLSKGAIATQSPDAGGQEETPGEKWAVNNYIVVQDFPEKLDAVAGMLEQIDRRPPQVLVEATILVASLSDTNQLGIDFSYFGGVNADFVGGDASLGVPSQAGTDGGVSTSFTGNVNAGGLKVGITSNNVGLIIRALESTTDVVTLGNPKVLTLNRQFGKVIVGNRDGYITTEVTQTTATQTVEFLETGTQLQFRPFVMDDGFIRMELNPKDSDGGVEVTGDFTLPSESTAEVVTNVLVKNGSTIVIGGLFREKTQLSRAQIPVLGNVPLLGNLFRSTGDIAEKEEVIFLITPHVIKEDVDYPLGKETLAKAKHWTVGIREGLQPTGRDRLATAYYNWAKQNQAKGKLSWALWDATMATNISPMCYEAIDLREQLQTQQVYETDCSLMSTFMRQLVAQDACK